MPAAALPIAHSWPGVVVPPAVLTPPPPAIWNELGRGSSAASLARTRMEAREESERLVARCQAGDRAAFREIFRLHRGDVARLVQRMLGQSADLEDVVQEVFFQVHRSIKDFRGQARFSTWLYRVTVNVV